MLKNIYSNLKDENLEFSKPIKQISKIDTYMKKTAKNVEHQKSSKALPKKNNLLKTKKNKNFQIKNNLKKTKRIKKISFVTSRTGRNLSKLKKKTIFRKKKLVFFEDEKNVFVKNHHMIHKTISQKNDNDIDSESDIIIMGVKYLHRKLIQSISKQQEIRKYQKKMQKAKKIEASRKNTKIQDYFKNQPLSFNTPSSRRVSVNDIAYLNSIMSAQRSVKTGMSRILGESTVVSKNSVLTDKASSKFWLETKNKTSAQTRHSNLKTFNARSRKGSGNFINEGAFKTSLGSMFSECPNLKKN